MPRWLLVVLGLAVLAAPAVAQPATPSATPARADTTSLTLEACLVQAIAQAPSLAAARAAVAEADAALSEARARRLPTLGLGANYQYTSTYMKQTLALGPGLPSRTLQFGDGHVADVNLGLSVPLFTGGELSHAAQAAAAGDSAAVLQGATTRLDLTRDVRQAFYTALGRRSQLAAASLAVTRLQRHVDDITGAQQAGAATEETRLRALARLSQAEQRRLQAAAASDSAGIALGRLLGQPTTSIRPAGSLAQSLLADQDRDPARVAQRPDLAALAHEESRQVNLARAARGRLWPRVAADVRGHYGRPGVDALTNDWMSYATVGVSLDWPLWDSGARSDRAQQAAARARGIAARRADVLDAITAAHATVQSQLAAAGAQLEQAAARADLQHRIADLVGQRYAQASATETEYLDAQDDLTQADIDLALARTRLRLAESALLWTLGD